MKESFEKALVELHTGLKEEGKFSDSPGIRAEIPQKAEREVKDLQKEKVQIMNRLHESLRLVDEGVGVEGGENARPVSWDEESQRLKLSSEKGEVEISTGELFTDGEGGAEYALDASLPRDVKKKFLLAETSREIAELADRQIATVEINTKARSGNLRDQAAAAKSRMGYSAVLERNKSGEHPTGIIAEKMTRLFLEKLAIDREMPFSVERVDIYEDVNGKIDFIVHVSKRSQGVKVGTEERKDVGIQFTRDIRQETQDNKKMQIEKSLRTKEERTSHVDSIVLVSLPLEDTKRLYERWRAKGSPPGGPEKYWDERTREQVFRGVLNGLYTPEEIDELWQKTKSAETPASPA